MNGNPVLDVAIGLVLMYLILSLLCTTINEIISTLANLRAETLKKALGRLIDVGFLKDAFYDHGLISSAVSKSDNHPSYLSGQTFALALLGCLDPTKPLPAFADVEDVVKTLPDSNIRDTLLMHIAMADGDMGKLRDNIAAWFDGAMDRVSGIYKRHLKAISLTVGVLLAVGLYANSITVAQTLWSSQALRDEVAAMAAKTVANGAPAPTQTDTDSQALSKQVGDDISQLKVFPIGWQTFQMPKSLIDGLIELFGVLFTGIALSLGAPFWFDLLSKFVNIRGAGAVPPRSEE